VAEIPSLCSVWLSGFMCQLAKMRFAAAVGA
jgi:hypothetical protein